MSLLGSLVVILLLLSLAVAAASFAPWVPTRQKDVERILRLANLKSGECFYDLGCGDGRTVFAAARAAGTKAIGVELALPMYIVCLVGKLVRRSPARFFWRNLFKINLSEADVIYVFGMPKKLTERFTAKIQQECRPGTRVLSYVFPIQAWTPETIDKPLENDMVIYRYIIS